MAKGAWYKQDSPEQIQMCLSCKKLQCINCIDYSSRAKKVRRFSSEELAIVREMIKQKKPYREVKKVVPIGNTYFYRIRKEMEVVQ